jgi:hypothetical protein
MYSCRKNNCSFFLIRSFSNGQIVTTKFILKLTYCLIPSDIRISFGTDSFSLGFVILTLNIFADECMYMGSNVRLKCYRNRLSKEESTFKFDSKRKAAVESTIFPLEVCCVVTNVVSISVPSCIFSSGVLFGIKQGFHSNVVETVWL